MWIVASSLLLTITLINLVSLFDFGEYQSLVNDNDLFSPLRAFAGARIGADALCFNNNNDISTTIIIYQNQYIAARQREHVMGAHMIAQQKEE